MSESELPKGRSSRVLAVLTLCYVEVQYWFVGLTPESYHWQKASAWEALENFPRAIKHLEAYLQSSEDFRMRALLGYCHVRLEQWASAQRAYLKALESWRHPSVILGLAETKLRLGDKHAARELADSVEREFPSREPYVEEALAYLKTELG